MPMYEFKCDACGHAFERYSAGLVTEEGGGACPKCGKGRARKVFSTFSSSCCNSTGTVTSSPAGCGGGKSPFS